MEKGQLLKRAIEKYGVESQVDVCIEEMAELTKALLKMRRGGKPEVAMRFDILDEIADVKIMIKQMELIYGYASDREEWKLKRLSDRLGIKKGENE